MIPTVPPKRLWPNSHLPKFLEYLGLVLRGDADAGVTDRDLHSTIDLLCGDPNPSSLGVNFTALERSCDLSCLVVYYLNLSKNFSFSNSCSKLKSRKASGFALGFLTSSSTALISSIVGNGRA